MRQPLLTIVTLLSAALWGMACGNNHSGAGNLEVRIWDHREAIADFQELRLTFAAVGIHPAVRPRTEGWIELKSTVQEIDLTWYVAGAEAMIGQSAVETGTYNGIRLSLDEVTGILRDGSRLR